ncbi:MAG: class IV adenylate cyclase [Planctomycetia bacterium]|jgi:predicted adenylyl cyclase CyaB|nr:class IV adenylate cyclase [Planctomycetia bacterium]MCC7314270.1 class IV adenylate cyclase [Planctomycetota bacterium]OQZ06925.1 MAG: hypothetical protein B6D36_02480 [Planctomycetes bacterium UTPLA1]
MAQELECKIAVPSHDRLVELLRAAGANRIGRVRETNRLLDTPDRALVHRGCGLRVRTIEVLDGTGPPSSLAFKGPVQESAFKCREEIQIDLPDRNPASPENGARAGEGMLRLLHAIGFAEWLTFEKNRESWQLDECAIELDELPLLGRFVEVEGPDDHEIRRCLEALGLDAARSIQTSYPGLLAKRMGETQPPWVVKF